jgi:acid phosphatase type 7
MVKHGAFTTAPRDESDETFRFLVYGDNRSDDAAHAAIVRAMVPVAADFLVHTGDFVEDGGSARQWQRFFEIEAPLVRERSLFSTIGNHELVDGKGLNYVRYFGTSEPPEPPVVAARAGAVAHVPDHLNTTFRWASARFFLLNGMVGWTSGKDREWLENELRAADAESGLTWRIVVVHHGPWSSGPHGGNRRLHEAQIPELLRAHGVDLVLSGHDHMYERGEAAGLPYVVTGGGGAPTYRIKSAQPTARKLEAVRHFVQASVSRTAMTLAATRADGSLIERCGLVKGTGWDCDGAEPGVAEPGAARPLPPRASPSPETSSRCACKAAGGAREGGLGAVGTVAAAAVVARLRRRRRRRP